MRPNNPTEAEIAAACLAIQAGWTEAERLRRLRADWRPSFIRADGIRQDMDSETYSGHHSERDRLQEGAHSPEVAT